MVRRNLGGGGMVHGGVAQGRGRRQIDTSNEEGARRSRGAGPCEEESDTRRRGKTRGEIQGPKGGHMLPDPTGGGGVTPRRGGVVELKKLRVRSSGNWC